MTGYDAVKPTDTLRLRTRKTGRPRNTPMRAMLHLERLDRHDHHDGVFAGLSVTAMELIESTE